MLIKDGVYTNSLATPLCTFLESVRIGWTPGIRGTLSPTETYVGLRLSIWKI